MGLQEIYEWVISYEESHKVSTSSAIKQFIKQHPNNSIRNFTMIRNYCMFQKRQVNKSKDFPFIIVDDFNKATPIVKEEKESLFSIIKGIISDFFRI